MDRRAVVVGTAEPVRRRPRVRRLTPRRCPSAPARGASRTGARTTLLLASLALAGGGAALAGCGDSGPAVPVQTLSPRSQKADLPPVDLAKPGEARTILLAGLDYRFADGPGARSRSDTMLLVRLDPDAGATAMLSLPRDLRVKGLGRPGADKLNSAWFLGGQRRLTRVIGESVLGTPEDPFVIDDVFSVRFSAFARLVNTLGCLYADIDRRYFVAPNSGHAEIDQPAGYQLLCGQDALAYVRFRVGDSDFVREARQANYLTEARTQIDPLKILSGGLVPRLAGFLGKSVKTKAELLQIAQLAVYVVGRPTARIELGDVRDAGDGSGDVVTTEAALARARKRFLDPALPSQKTPVAERTGRPPVLPERGRRVRTGEPATLTADVAGARTAARAVARRARGVAVFVPDLRLGSATYDAASSRGYRILAPDKRPRWPGYRIVLRTPTGQAYGIQGTTWDAPPALDLATDVIRLGGRTWKVQVVGRRIHRLFWQAEDGSTYWVTNTLTDDLTAQQMYAIAKSLERRAG
jgi:LCP family protein required for cell wall assembly